MAEAQVKFHSTDIVFFIDHKKGEKLDKDEFYVNSIKLTLKLVILNQIYTI